jgi:hypothetical protein
MRFGEIHGLVSGRLLISGHTDCVPQNEVAGLEVLQRQKDQACISLGTFYDELLGNRVFSHSLVVNAGILARFSATRWRKEERLISRPILGRRIQLQGI